MIVKASVVIPVYNSEPFIERTLESVFRQTEPAHEIIVVDDASPSATPSLVRYLSRIRYIRLEKNSGVSAARNAGVKAATGNYIAFLDHDDLCFRNRLEISAAYAKRFPDRGLFCSDAIVTRADTFWRRKRHFETSRYRRALLSGKPLGEQAFRMLLHENFICSASVTFMKKDFYESIGGFDENIRLAEDFEFWLRCSLATDIVLMPEVLIYKRAHHANVSGDWAKVCRAHEAVLEKLYREKRELLRDRNCVGDCLQAMADTHFEWGNDEYEKGRREEAYRLYNKGFLCKPSPANALKYMRYVLRKRLREMTGIRRNPHARY